MILKEQTNNNTQLCENEEEKKDESIDKNKKQNTLKKEPIPIEFYDIYP